jgi:hypothetical protein
VWLLNDRRPCLELQRLLESTTSPVLSEVRGASVASLEEFMHESTQGVPQEVPQLSGKTCQRPTPERATAAEVRSTRASGHLPLQRAMIEDLLQYHSASIRHLDPSVDRDAEWDTAASVAVGPPNLPICLRGALDKVLYHSIMQLHKPQCDMTNMNCTYLGLE